MRDEASCTSIKVHIFHSEWPGMTCIGKLEQFANLTVSKRSARRISNYIAQIIFRLGISFGHLKFYFHYINTILGG